MELLMAVLQDLELQPYDEAVRIHMEYPAVPEASIFWQQSAAIVVCWFYTWACNILHFYMFYKV